MGNGRSPKVWIAVAGVVGLMIVAPFLMARLSPVGEPVRSPEKRATAACHREVGKLVDYAWKYPSKQQEITQGPAEGEWVVSGAVNGKSGFGHPGRWFVCSGKLDGNNEFLPSRSIVVFDNPQTVEEAAAEYRAGGDWPAGLPGEVARS